MFFFHKKQSVSHESLVLVALFVFISIMFSVSAYFQFQNIQALSQNIRGLAREVQDLKDQTISPEEIQTAEKALVGIESDVPLFELSIKDVKNIFEDPGFALSKIPVSPQPFSLIGSGVIIDKDHGIVATSYHVVKNQMAKFKIKTSDKQESTAKVLSFNAEKDLALLQIDDINVLKNTEALTLASAPAVFGDNMEGFGFSSEQSRLLIGQVINPKVSLSEFPQAEVFRTNFKIQPGDSGGPIINGRGELVGLLTAFSLSEEESLAVAVSRIKELKK